MLCWSNAPIGRVTSRNAIGISCRDELSANILRARLVGAVADSVAEIGVLAEAIGIGGTAAQGRSEGEQIRDAGFLEMESVTREKVRSNDEVDQESRSQ